MKHKNIQKELQSIAPSLVNVPKVDLRPTVSSYFDQMQASVLSKLDMPVNEEQSPAPDYFHKMQEEVVHRIQVKNKKKMKVIRLAIAIAAIFIFGLLFVQLFQNKLMKHDMTLYSGVEEMTDDELIYMLESESQSLGFASQMHEDLIISSLNTEDSELDILEEMIDEADVQDLIELF